jgi:hypothetical protein
MRRKAAAVLMLAALGGCTSFQGGPVTGSGNAPHWGRSYGPPIVPGVKGPYGEDVAMAAPYDSAPPGSAYLARQMMSQSVPLSAVQVNNPGGAMPGMFPGGMPPGAMMPNTVVPRGPVLSPPGVPFGPGAPSGQNVPGGPSMLPGMPPGLAPAGGTMPMGGGVINANMPPGMMSPGAIMQAQMAQANAAGIRFQGQRTQIRFVRPSGMRVSWFTQGADGHPTYSTTPVEAPGRYNFPQAAIYRLKLSNIEGRPGLEIYPTMEVVPCNPRTEAFLAHSAVPIDFTNEDFRQIADGNYLVKVIYLPDPQFQDAAGTGTDEILSTRLDPGADPIQEALRRGSILVVLRMGNVDQEAPNTPPLNAPASHAGTAPAPQMMAQPGPGMIAPPPPPPYASRRPNPSAVEVSLPKETGTPGTSSTSKFRDAPPLPPAPARIPSGLGSQPAPPVVPQSSGPAFPAISGPNLSGVPPLPMNRAPEVPSDLPPSVPERK